MSDEPRLYLDTPSRMDPAAFAEVLGGVLAEVPVACVRLTLESAADEAAWMLAANHLMPVCHDADVPLVITDHFRLVAPLGLDGVHLATARTPVREVRKTLGNDRIVGAFAGTTRHNGVTLADAGADYVSFGPVGDAGALGDEDRAGDDLFTWWAEMIETPIVAEGRVSLGDARRLAEITDFVVPDIGLWDTEAPVQSLRAFADVLAD